MKTCAKIVIVILQGYGCHNLTPIEASLPSHMNPNHEYGIIPVRC